MKNIPKKYLVTGVVVAIILVVVLVIFNPFKKPLDSATIATRRSAVEFLSVKILVDLIGYYNIDTNNLAFTKSPVAKEQVASEISDLKTKYGGDYDYRIFETSEIGLSVKTVEKTTDTYYCVDNNKKTPVEIKKEQFTLNTDCYGHEFI